jgi:hypothetical protein
MCCPAFTATLELNLLEDMLWRVAGGIALLEVLDGAILQMIFIPIF